MRGGGFPHPLFIYYHTLRILSTTLQKPRFNLCYPVLIYAAAAALYLYFSFYYTIPRKFCQPLFSLASWTYFIDKNPTPYIYIYIIPQIIVFVNMVMS